MDKKKKEDLEISKYDFIPKINNSNNVKNAHGQNRFDMLYKVAELNENQNRINKKDKTKDDIEVEKNANELTFKPQINKNYKLKNLNSNIPG